MPKERPVLNVGDRLGLPIVAVHPGSSHPYTVKTGESPKTGKSFHLSIPRDLCDDDDFELNLEWGMKIRVTKWVGRDYHTGVFLVARVITGRVAIAHLLNERGESAYLHSDDEWEVVSE